MCGITDSDISTFDMALTFARDISLMPDLRHCAILLDIDGTILDLAPSPQQVSVPAGIAADASAAGCPDRRRAGAGLAAARSTTSI